MTSVASLMTRLWLGPKVTWEDFPNDGASVWDMWVSVLMVPVWLLLRHVSDRAWRPVLLRMVAASDLSQIKKDRYERKSLQKGSECAFFVLVYSVSSAMMMYVLWDKAWTWDTRLMWEDWPNQDFPADVYWLYTVQMGFYLTQTLAIIVFNDHDKKDQFIMLLHHLITIVLLVTSFWLRFHRIGCMVLLVHDFADPLTNASKLFYDCGWMGATERVFVPGYVLWVVSRNLLFPLRLIRSLLFEAKENPVLCTDSGIYFFFAGLLSTLGVFHLWWTWLFSKILLQKFTEGEMTKDEFDPDTDEDEEEEEEEDGGKTVKGGDGGVGEGGGDHVPGPEVHPHID